jgi:PhnB protein
MAVNPIPDGCNVLTPILVVDNADALIDFLRRVFDAKDFQIARRPDGKVWHADLTIGGEHIMVSDSSPQFAAGGSIVNVYLPDVDAAYKRALEAGATSMGAPDNRFYGDRLAIVKDPSGTVWSMATHVEDVPAAELKRREAEAIRQMAAGSTSGHE